METRRAARGRERGYRPSPPAGKGSSQGGLGHRAARSSSYPAQGVGDETDIFPGANHQWGALVQRFGQDVQDAVDTVRGRAFGLLGDERHRAGFIEKAEFASNITIICRVQKYAAGDQIAMKIAHQGSDVAAVLWGNPVGQVPLQSPDGCLHSFIPAAEIALVYTVVLPHPGSNDSGVRQEELTNCWIQGEAVSALPRGIDQHGAGAVHDVSGRDLLAPGLQNVGRRSPALHAHPAIDAEYGPHR